MNVQRPPSSHRWAAVRSPERREATSCSRAACRSLLPTTIGSGLPWRHRRRVAHRLLFLSCLPCLCPITCGDQWPINWGRRIPFLPQLKICPEEGVLLQARRNVPLLPGDELDYHPKRGYRVYNRRLDGWEKVETDDPFFNLPAAPYNSAMYQYGLDEREEREQLFGIQAPRKNKVPRPPVEIAADEKTQLRPEQRPSEPPKKRMITPPSCKTPPNKRTRREKGISKKRRSWRTVQRSSKKPSNP